MSASELEIEALDTLIILCHESINDLTEQFEQTPYKLLEVLKHLV